MGKCKSFKPSINEQSKILILGSMPGVKSFEEQQYYAHPQNRFWKIMSDICDFDLVNSNYKIRLNKLLDNGIALWDTIGVCEREGSLDSDIQKEVPNDIRKLLKKYPQIRKICLNGNKSYNLFKKHFPEVISSGEYTIYHLPSTSPANARFRLRELTELWMNAIK